MDEQYFYSVDNQQRGPVSLAELRAMAARAELKRQQRVWREGLPGWVAAGSVEELFRGLLPELVPDQSPPRRATPPPLEDPTTSAPAAPAPSSPPSPGLMAGLSFFLPGVGQIICGQTSKGLIFLVYSIVANVGSSGLTSLFLCPLLSYDAYRVAQARRQGQTLDAWEFFPNSEAFRGMKSEVVVGFIIAVTLILLVLVRFGI